MIQQVKIRDMKQINALVRAAGALPNDVGVHDANGDIADAKSILGMLRLDYSRPVKVVSGSRYALRACLRALHA